MFGRDIHSSEIVIRSTTCIRTMQTIKMFMYERERIIITYLYQSIYQAALPLREGPQDKVSTYIHTTAYAYKHEQEA